MISRFSTLEDVCFEVSTALAAHGITAILTGGSAASIYAPQAYMSLDADFILEADDPLDAVDVALQPIGFSRIAKSRIFAHSESDFTLDFPKGPLAVGGDYIAETAILERGRERLWILRRIDCVRDRLAHFYYWNDYTALNAAVAVAAPQLGEDDRKFLYSWTARESPDLLEKFAEFERRLSAYVA